MKTSHLQGGPGHLHGGMGGEQHLGKLGNGHRGADGGGIGAETVEVEDVLGAIAGSGGGGSAVASTLGGRRHQSPEPPPTP
jgi:hypothetical protein